jgi:hypothetical protein
MIPSYVLLSAGEFPLPAVLITKALDVSVLPERKSGSSS